MYAKSRSNLGSRSIKIDVKGTHGLIESVHIRRWRDLLSYCKAYCLSSPHHRLWIYSHLTVVSLWVARKAASWLTIPSLFIVCEPPRLISDVLSHRNRIYASLINSRWSSIRMSRRYNYFSPCIVLLTANYSPSGSLKLFPPPGLNRIISHSFCSWGKLVIYFFGSELMWQRKEPTRCAFIGSSNRIWTTDSAIKKKFF